MLRKLGFPLFLLAMFSLAGGHWALLQSIAWVGMLQEYGRTASMSEAVDKTFSGNFPCDMCKKIAQAKEKEQEAPTFVKADKKAESYVQPLVADLLKPIGVGFHYPRSHAEHGPLREDAPPRPVPEVLHQSVA